MHTRYYYGLKTLLLVLIVPVILVYETFITHGLQIVVAHIIARFGVGAADEVAQKFLRVQVYLVKAL